MQQPQAFVSVDSTQVCKLHKAIYGLKQAPRQWFERLQVALLKLQFQPSKCDPSLFTYLANGHTVYLLVYLDDIIIIGSSEPLIKSIVTQLNGEFSLKFLGDLDYFLGIKVKKAPNGSLLPT